MPVIWMKKIQFDSSVCINEQSDTLSRDAFAQIDAFREGVSEIFYTDN